MEPRAGEPDRLPRRLRARRGSRAGGLRDRGRAVAARGNAEQPARLARHHGAQPRDRPHPARADADGENAPARAARGDGGRDGRDDDWRRAARARVHLLPSGARLDAQVALTLRTLGGLDDGGIVVLRDQDRSLWNCDEIAAGRAVLDRALALDARGVYALQAAIASLHAMILQDWPRSPRSTPEALLELDPAFARALHGVAPGQDLIVLTWLHRADRGVLETHPRNDPAAPLTGVFATRSPDRPNPIGLHRVTVVALEGTDPPARRRARGDRRHADRGPEGGAAARRLISATRPGPLGVSLMWSCGGAGTIGRHRLLELRMTDSTLVRSFRTTLLIALGAAVLVPGAASAATVTRDGAGALVYTAAGGATNNVDVQQDDAGAITFYTGGGDVMTAIGAGCVAERHLARRGRHLHARRRGPRRARRRRRSRRRLGRGQRAGHDRRRGGQRPARGRAALEHARRRRGRRPAQRRRGRRRPARRRRCRRHPGQGRP